MKNMRNKGFTLIELIVVIAILGVLAAVLIPSISNYVNRANLSVASKNGSVVLSAAQRINTKIGTGELSSLDADTIYAECGIEVSLGASAPTTDGVVMEVVDNQVQTIWSRKGDQLATWTKADGWDFTVSSGGGSGGSGGGTPQEFTVTFNYQGATGAFETVTVTSGSTYGSLPTPTMSGYSFSGWFTAESGGEQITSDTPVSLSSDTTIFARWTANNNSVSFNGNGSTSGSMSPQTLATGATANLTTNAYERVGYTFAGWATTAGGEVEYADQASYTMGASAVILYAKWEAMQLTVTLDNNGGSGGTSSVSVINGQSMPSATAPTRTGFAFRGYWTNTDGTGVQYYANNMSSARVCDLSTNTTLYAHWLQIYTVTLDRQGGSGGSTVISAIYGEPIPSSSKPSKFGHIFYGYYSGVNGTGTHYHNSNGTSVRNYDLTSNTTLYAHWVNKVNLSKNDGTTSTNTVYATNGLPMPRPSSKPTRTGYVFMGYYSATTGGTQYYSSNLDSMRNWDKTSETTLYAQWAQSYVVTLNKSGGAFGTNSVIAVNGQPMPTGHNIYAPDRPGMTFMGYFTELNGQGTKYYSAGAFANAPLISARNFDLTNNVTLYAHWV